MISAGDLAQDAAEREWDRMSDDERAAVEADIDAEAAYYAALMAEAERAQAAHIAAEDARIAGALVQVGPYTYADPQCKFCWGTGVVTDSVPYGGTTAQLESPCECAVDYLWAVTNGEGIELGNICAVQVLMGGNSAMGEFDASGKALWTRVYPTAAALLEACATIAPLTAWQVVWDDMGADDAPKF